MGTISLLFIDSDFLFIMHINPFKQWGRHGRDRMVVGFTTNCAINAYHHYVINFVSNLRQDGGFLRVHWFAPQIKLTATI